MSFWGHTLDGLVNHAGLAILIPCFLLVALARIRLGRPFSVRAKASTLVTTGLYSRIRNPIYVFATPVLIGVVLWVNKDSPGRATLSCYD